MMDVIIYPYLDYNLARITIKQYEKRDPDDEEYSWSSI